MPRRRRPIRPYKPHAQHKDVSIQLDKAVTRMKSRYTRIKTNLHAAEDRLDAR